jgi:hypothetical protein
MLNLKQIRKLTSSAFMGERLFHADLLNASSEDLCDDIENVFWFASKAYHQAKNLNDCLNSLHEKLTDFVNGNFETYIDKHLEYSEDGDPEFDPYEELRYAMNNNDWIYTLPDDISQYIELILFADKYGLRQKAQSEAFKTCFPGIKYSYSSINEFGEAVIIEEDKLSSEVKDTMDINRQISEIDIEHCQDNYNQWHKHMTDLIAQKGSFAEMLALFN